jgi:hypothetical protein
MKYIRKINLAPAIIFAEGLKKEECRNARKDAAASSAGKIYIFSMRDGPNNTFELIGRNRELCNPSYFNDSSLTIKVWGD